MFYTRVYTATYSLPRHVLLNAEIDITVNEVHSQIVHLENVSTTSGVELGLNYMHISSLYRDV
jgi:hypothetical protein